MDKGQLVPDQVTIDLLSSELESYSDSKGFIFDGFPRTILQAKNLDILIEKYKQKLFCFSNYSRFFLCLRYSKCWKGKSYLFSWI